MATYLKQQLQTRLKASNLSVYALEKKSGLNRGTASNILRGLSKHPSAENLAAIATALNCSIEDLIGSNYNVPRRASKSQSIPDEILEWDKDLFTNCMNEVSKALEKMKVKPKYNEVISIVKEIYKFAVAKKSNTADPEFTTWIIERMI